MKNITVIMLCVCIFSVHAQQKSYLVKDIKPGKLSSNIENIIQSDGILYFTADDGENGTQLWCSDGTEAGTKRISNLVNRNMPRVYSAGGKIFFTIWTHTQKTVLYTTDRSAVGLQKVTEWEGSLLLNNLQNINGALIFTLSSTVDSSGIWRSDGTPEGTYFLKGVSLQTTTPIFQKVGNTLFFYAQTYSSQELWSTDGTVSGTKLLKGDFPAKIQQLVDVGNTLYLVVAGAPYVKLSIWKSDGTAAGTVKVIELPSDILQWMAATPSGKIFCITENRDISNKRTYELWASDGTQAGTLKIQEFKEFRFEFGATNLAIAGENAFFTAGTDESTNELWRSDGMPAGTYPVRDIYYNYSANPKYFTSHSDKLYFITNHPGKSMSEIWRSDGTSEGTSRVDSNGNMSDFLTACGDKLFFLSNDATAKNESGMELWAIEINKITGIQNQTIEEVSFHIYPNPFSTSATITNLSGDVAFEYVLFDMLGREVKRYKTTDNQFMLESTTINDGVYTLQWLNGNNTISQRLVIMR